MTDVVIGAASAALMIFVISKTGPGSRQGEDQTCFVVTPSGAQA